VREWFEGESLRSDLERRREAKKTGRPLDEALALLETAFDGLAYAHAQNEMHLSVNPSNLFLVAPDGARPAALKVLDFGVAGTMSAFASRAPGGTSGLRLLFPAYAAPEQLDRNAGAPGPATDVYALALVMMEMLSDRVVMSEADSGAIVEHALDEQRRPTPQAHGLKLPSHIDRALVRAVSRAPDRRQKSAAELWKDLRNTVRTVVPRAAPLATPAMPGMPVSQPPRAASPPSPALPMSQPPRALPSRAPLGRPSLPPSLSPSRPPLPANPSQPAAALRTPPPGFVRSKTLVGLQAVVPPPSIAPVAPSQASTVRAPSVMPSQASTVREPSLAEVERLPEPSLGAVSTQPEPQLAPDTLPDPHSDPAEFAAPAPSFGDPPPAAPSASGGLEPVASTPQPWPLPIRRHPAGLADAIDWLRARGLERVVDRLRSPQAAAIALPVAGALFWTAVAAVFLLLMTAPLRRSAAAPAPAESATAATTAPPAVPPPPPPAAPPAATVAPPSPPSTAAAPAPAAPAADTAPSTAANPRFEPNVAIRALDGRWREVAKCRRGNKLWGKAATTVTFAGDGSVRHVDVGTPFGGTPTGDCIADQLATVRVGAFGGDDATLVYRVYVAPR
jgi:serine/threonine protein kinase